MSRRELGESSQQHLMTCPLIAEREDSESSCRSQMKPGRDYNLGLAGTMVIEDKGWQWRK